MSFDANSRNSSGTSRDGACCARFFARQFFAGDYIQGHVGKARRRWRCIRGIVALEILASVIHICIHPTSYQTKTTYVIPQISPSTQLFNQQSTSECLLSRVCSSLSHLSIYPNNVSRLRLFHSRRCFRCTNPGLHLGTHVNTRDSPRCIRRTWFDLAGSRPLPSLLP
jgi:hypothetical protein